MRNKRKTNSDDGMADEEPSKNSKVPKTASSSEKVAANNIFDGLDASEADIGAVIESINSGSDYILQVAVCPVVPPPPDGKKGPIQRSAVLTVRFQKAANEVDCWCFKPSHVIDSIRVTKKLYPKIALAEYFDSLREYSVREVPQGPNVPLSRSSRNGGRFETRILAGFIPLGPKSDYRMVAAGIGRTLSDFIRSKLFCKIYLDIVNKSVKDSGTMDTGRQGIYGIIKDKKYFFWDALEGHRLCMAYDVPLDSFFLDSTISEMLSRMFPDGNCLDLPDVRAVGYKDESTEDSN